MIINGKEIRINRANAVVSQVDELYMQLVQQILDEGLRTNNRTGIDTISIAGWCGKIDLSKGYPILETKKVVAKNFASEIQWIHQEQSNDVQWLWDRDNRIWDEWCIDSDGIWREYEQGENAIDDPDRAVPLMRQVFDHKDGDVKKIRKLDKYGNQPMIRPGGESLENYIKKNGKLPTIKRATYFGEKYARTIGEQYGFINKKYRQPQCVEKTLKNNPNDRRMQINLWQKAHFAKAVLPSCVFDCEFKVTPDGKLHAFVHQRSADVPAGVPFNLAQYALLVCMFAKANGLEPGTMSWSIMDAHIYVNQLENIKKQLRRYNYMKEYSVAIQESTDEELETLYNKLCETYDRIHKYARQLLNIDIDDLPMSKRISLLEIKDKQLAKDYEEAFERKIAFEHMVTRETPELELASHDSIFEYSTDYVKKGDSYLKENPIGNKELVLKKYHPTPFISMPIAQ